MSKLLVLQIEDRKDEFLNSLMQKNRLVCLQNGIEYMHMKSGPPDVAVYWSKVFELDRIMNSRKDIDMIMWLDSDAFFAQFQTMNPFMLVKMHPKYVIWISPDAPPKYHAPFCAGAFLIKNDTEGRKLIRYWRDLYNKDRWVLKDGRWSTIGDFAGPDYEQGAFIDYMLKNDSWKNRICTLPYYVFNEVECEFPNPLTISIHLAGHYKDDHKQKCQKTIIESYESFSQSGHKYEIFIAIFTITIFILYVMNVKGYLK
jgi:hypothetical protein